MIRPSAKENSQAGMASILITMITMIVVSLVVIGFATISQREQGNTLDQQLSTQAFYAAESGVEDARNVIAQDVNTPAGVPPKKNCTSDDTSKLYKVNYPTSVSGTTVLDSTDNVSYSCLLVNPDETSLVYDGIGDQSRVIPISASKNIDKIKITWTPTSKPSGTPAQCPGSTAHQFSIASKWACGYGLMSVDLVPTQGMVLTRTNLEKSEITSFFQPQNIPSPTGGDLSYTGNNGRANVVAASCGLSSYTQCSATISNLPASTSFSLRLNSLYQPSNVTVTAYNGPSTVTIIGTQVTVDVTGNANGVLRRIQVRIPATESSNLIPDMGIESNGALCKRFKVTPGYYANAGDVVNPAPIGSPYYNQMCDNSITSGTPSAGG